MMKMHLNVLLLISVDSLSYLVYTLITIIYSRHIVFILSGVLVLFSGLLVLAGVVMGMAGASRYDTPATRSRITHIGGKVILW